MSTKLDEVVVNNALAASRRSEFRTQLPHVWLTSATFSKEQRAMIMLTKGKRPVVNAALRVRFCSHNSFMSFNLTGESRRCATIRDTLQHLSLICNDMHCI